MEFKKYLEFDLMLERTETGYRARVLAAPTGTAVGEFGFPFSELELENFVLRMGQKRQSTRGGESSEMVAAQEFGTRLYDTVFAGSLRSAFDGSLLKAAEQATGLRIRLRFASSAPELIDLPWEYLYNPDKNRFLCLSVDSPLVRDLDLTGRIEPLQIKPPLRVLVVISSPSDFAPLDVEKEWQRLKEAVADLEASGRIILDRADKATPSALRRYLRGEDYHIFHFIGHGGFDTQANDGVLIFVDENGRGRKIGGQQLGTMLHDEKTLRLAILNACEGGRTSYTDPFAGVAQSLLQQDIPAVIAMQFEVSDRAAITLAHEFYAAIADGYPVDAALSEARKSIYTDVSEVEWGTPVLYMRVADGRIFDIVGQALPIPTPTVPLPSAILLQSVSSAQAPTLAPIAAQPVSQAMRRPLTTMGIAIAVVILLIVGVFSLRNILYPEDTSVAVNNPALTVSAAMAQADSENGTATAVAAATAQAVAAATEQSRFTATAGSVATVTATVLPTLTPTPPPSQRIQIGASVNGTAIEVIRIGTGNKHIVLVGGIHAGFAPSSVILAERTARYFLDNPEEVLSTATLHIVLNLNPDSPYKPGDVQGRLNGNRVDLNRNWDCDWKKNAEYAATPVSGGSEPFSEPETQALKEYLDELRPQAVVFWEAKREGGLASPGGCETSSKVSESLARIYGNSARYKAAPFDGYVVNGDATNWLDNDGIPAISVLTPDYKTIDETNWNANLRAILAVLESYGN